MIQEGSRAESCCVLLTMTQTLIVVLHCGCSLWVCIHEGEREEDKAGGEAEGSLQGSRAGE